MGLPVEAMRQETWMLWGKISINKLFFKIIFVCSDKLYNKLPGSWLPFWISSFQVQHSWRMWSCTEGARPSFKQADGRTGRQRDCASTSAMEKHTNTLFYIVIFGVFSPQGLKIVSYALSKTGQQRNTSMFKNTMGEHWKVSINWINSW